LVFVERILEGMEFEIWVAKELNMK